MVQKRKINTSTSVKKKSTSASSIKRKLGDTSLDWITDTTEGELILQEQEKNIPGKSAGVSKETKIGVLKHYESKEAEKKKDETPEVTPAISVSSSTITKGKRVTSAKEEEAQKIKVVEEEKTTTGKEPLSVPDDSAEIAGEKMDKEIVTKQEKEPEVKDEKVEETVKKGKEKTITAEESPVEIGKTYKITEEKKVVLADEEDKTVPAKKVAVSDDKKFPPEYEVKKEDVTTKEGISEELSVRIPEDSTSIVKKRKEAAFKEEEISGKEKTTIEKKKTAAVAAKEEVPLSAKMKLIKISGIGDALKKGGIKVSSAVVKPFKSDKTKLRKSVGYVINVSKQPVRSISAVDRKITKSMKKVVLYSDLGISEKPIIKNIKSTDAQITKSAKKLINSILD